MTGASNPLLSQNIVLNIKSVYCAAKSKLTLSSPMPLCTCHVAYYEAKTLNLKSSQIHHSKLPFDIIIL